MSPPRWNSRKAKPCDSSQLAISFACDGSSSSTAMRGAPATLLVRSEGIRSPVAMIVPMGGAEVTADPLRRKVLHVEDDPGVQALVRATLVRDGYEVHTASSGSRAIELA